MLKTLKKYLSVSTSIIKFQSEQKITEQVLTATSIKQILSLIVILRFVTFLRLI